ncbi:MAG: phage major capsid protein [Chloroflexales bacterium]|nr:phage major capsid protein [Chloroflexales bacterium]
MTDPMLTLETRAAFRAFLRGATAPALLAHNDGTTLEAVGHAIQADARNHRAAFRPQDYQALIQADLLDLGLADYGPKVRKALQADADTAGGYLLGVALVDELLQAEQQISAMRRLCRVLPPTRTGTVTVPIQRTRFSDAEWTTELEIGSEETLTPYGARVLRPYPLARWVKASNTFIRQPLGEQASIDALAEALAVPSEAAFLTGSGQQQPLGLLTASANVPQVTTASAGTLTAADLKRWLFRLPGSYQATATILCHVDFMAMAAVLDDGSLDVRRDSVLGYPVAFSDQFPSAGTDPTSLTTGASLAVVGDFARGYWIQDYELPLIQRLDELFAETNETALLARVETDAQPVVTDAFRILTVA